MNEKRREMLVYKVTFLNNEVISCGVTDPQKHKTMREDIYYSENNGLLIFALIKANSKEQALSKASRLAKDFPGHEAPSGYEYRNTAVHNDRSTTEHFTQMSGPVSTPDYIDTTSTSHAPRDARDERNNDSRVNPHSPR